MQINATGLTVLIIESDSSFPEGYGAAARLRLLGRGLAEAGAAVTVLLAKPHEAAEAPLNRDTTGCYSGVRFEYTCGTAVKPRNFLRRRIAGSRGCAVLIWRILRASRASNPSILLYANSPSTCIPVFLVAAILRIPVIVDLCEWGQTLFSAPSLSEVWQKLRIRFADGVITISDDLSRRASEALPRDRRGRILQVPVLVDLAQFSRPRAHVSEEFSGPYILWSGDVEGYVHLVVWMIRCFANSGLSSHGLILVIAGEAPPALREEDRKSTR